MNTKRKALLMAEIAAAMMMMGGAPTNPIGYRKSSEPIKSKLTKKQSSARSKAKKAKKARRNNR